MRVFIFRAGYGHTSQSQNNGDSHFLFSFGPIPSDEESGILGSGPRPWKSFRVPYGSRVLRDPSTGREGLLLPDESVPLTPEAVAERFEE